MTTPPVHQQPDTVYIIGHRNPDTDSICSAIAYAALRQATDLPGAIAVRLGPVGAEAAFALEQFGVPPPVLLEDVRRRVSDVMNRDVIMIHAEDTIYQAARLMREGSKGLLPVVDAERQLLGVITVDDIAGRYLDELMVVATSKAPLLLGRLLPILDGQLLTGELHRSFSGRVWIIASQPATLSTWVRPGDLAIVGDREDAQLAALDCGVACLIIVGTTPPGAEVLAVAQERGVVVMTSKHDSYATARLLSLSQPVTAGMRQPQRTVDPTDLVDDIAAPLLTAPGRALAVVDDDGRVCGTVSRSDILRGWRKRVILVDHNQRGQAVEGIEEAELIGVVDHHNLGDLHTAEPIPFILEPVGCTATIVFDQYRRAGLTPTGPIAGLLLAAIISDTLMLTSPTTTDRDRAALQELGLLAEVEPTTFAQGLFEARSDFSTTTPREIILSNLKEYEFGGARLAIGQAETLATEYFQQHEASFVAALQTLKDERAYDYCLFLITDILYSESVALYPGQVEQGLVANAFGLDQSVTGAVAARLPGIVSRKKQIIPPLARALERR